MKQNQLRKAEILLDAMSEIDDLYLTEALSQFPSAAPSHRKRILTSPMMRALPAVAALAAVLALVFTGPFNGLFTKKDAENADTPHKNENSTMTESTSVTALNSILQSCTESPSFTSISADDIAFFDGNVRLTVKDHQTGTLYVSRPLTRSEQTKLLNEFERVGKRVSDTEETDEAYSVWVTLGDGQVVTPCLPATAGNVGAGMLFDYASERIPTQTFFDLIKTLI